MSVFAIHVAKGQEIQVKMLMEKYLDYYQEKNVVKDILAFETSTFSKGVEKVKSAFSEGYIFLELIDCVSQIPPRLWSIIKQVPKVITILNQPIPEEEMENLKSHLDTEPSVEVVSTVEEEQQLKNQREVYLHMVNTATTQETKKKYMMLLNKKSLKEKFAEIVALTKKKKNNWIQNLRIKTTGKKLTIQIPLNLYNTYFYTKNTADQVINKLYQHIKSGVFNE